MISYVVLRVRDSAITMLLLIVILTIALAPSSSLTSKLFVSSFHTAPTIQRGRRSSVITARIIRPPSLTRLQLSSTTTSMATTSAATLSYLNSLQSITSNPNLFPATSDTIEALLNQQQHGGEISPKDFLMNLSREVMLASTSSKEEGSVSSAAEETNAASPTVTAAVPDSIISSPNNNSNLISEGMTAEEAASARTNRLQSNTALQTNTNLSAVAMAVTEGMTAEQAQTARMARLQSSTPAVQTNNGESNTSPINNNRSVSGLRQAASSTSRMRVKEPSAYTSTIIQDDSSADSSDIQDDDELLSTSSTTTTKFLGVTYANPQTPVIATTTGIATGLASYNLIDDYAYQFNTLHNEFILNQMDQNDKLAQQWDGLVTTYGVPVQDWIEGHPELVEKWDEFNHELGVLNHELVEQWDELIGSYFAPVEGGSVVGGEGVVGGALVEFESVDSSSAAAPPSSPDEVPMDQGSVINAPVEASFDTLEPAPIEQLSDASVGTTIGSSETATVPPPTAPLNSATAESTTAAPSSLDDFLPAIDDVAATTSASSFESVNTNMMPATTTTTAPAEAATEATAAVPSLNGGAVEEVATSSSAPVASFDSASGNMDLVSDGTASAAAPVVDAGAGAGTIAASPSLKEASVDVAAPVDATPYVEAASNIESTSVPSLDVGTVEEVATNNAPMELASDGTAAAVVEPAQYSDVSSGADTIAAAPSLNEATAVDVAAPVDATQYVEAASPIDSISAVPSMNDVKVEEVVSNAPATSFDSASTDLLAEATPVDHAQSVIASVEEGDIIYQNDMNPPVSSIESSNAGLLADATPSAPVDPAQYSETTTVPSINGATVNQDAAPTFKDLPTDAKTSVHTDPVDATQYSEATTVPSMDGAALNQGVGSSTPPTFEDFLAAAKTSAPADPAQYSETLPSMNGATVNPDVGSSPTTFESGNTDLLADATTSAPVAPTQLSDVSGADTANAAPSLNDVTTIDQNVLNTPVPSYDSGNVDLFAESTHQQRWFTAPTNQYTPADYATTIDQSGSSSGGGFSFDAGSNGGSSLTDSYSSWQSQGGSNPLRELAASLPPPEDRIRFTGGDYYSEAVTSQWAPTQGDRFYPVADTVTGMDGFADSVLSNDYSVPPISNGEFEASIPSIPTDALDSFTTPPSIDASINDLLASSKANLFGSVSHSFGDIQGKVNVPGDHLPFDHVLQNAGETFQAFHPPAAVSSAIQHASDASLADIGNSIMGAVKFMAGILLTVIDANLDLAAPGSSSASVLEGVKSSVNFMLDNASYTVANVINDVGNLSLKDIVHNLMILIVATTDMIMKVMNAVVYLLSGKDAGNWALQATSTVNEATSQLLAQADDVTHESIGDLANSIGDYSYHVGNELVALLGSLNGAEGAHFDGALDMVTTALQTGFTMQ